MKTFMAYVLRRMREPSTWRGLILVATSAGVFVSSALAEDIVAVGIGIAGILGAVFPDAVSGGNQAAENNRRMAREIVQKID